jgi:hypothetical protein
VRHLTFCLFLFGCGFSAVNNNIDVDLAMPDNGDLAGADFAGVDFALSNNADLAGGCNTCNCGQPALLIAIQSVNGALATDGRILQFALGNPRTRCKDLTVGKTLDKSPRAFSWYPPDSILYGGETTLYLIDAVKDLYRWNYKTPRSDYPRSAFPLIKDGAQVVGAGFDTTNFSEIQQLYILDPKNGMRLFNWDVTDQAGPIVLGGGIPEMTQSPLDPTHVFYLKTIINDAPAADVAVPYDDVMVKPTVYWAQKPTGAYLSTIESVKDAPGGLTRTVWLQHSSSSTQGDAVYYVNDDGTGPALTGPLSCNNPACKSPFKANDAAPDPTSTNAVFATCESPMSNQGHVVRIDDNGVCDLILDGTTLATLTYPSRLAIAPAR